MVSFCAIHSFSYSFSHSLIYSCIESSIDYRRFNYLAFVPSCAIRGPPPAYPVAALDKSLIKPFRILVNVCSSFPALFEHLHDAELPVNRVYNFRDELPNSVVDLIDRIVLVDSPEKIHSLFNYEQSHVFGLKFLAAMISSLDSLLFLQVGV